MYRSLNIGARLALAFGALVAIALSLAALAMIRLSEGSALLAQERHIRSTQLAPLYELREALDQTGLAARNVYIYQDPASVERELAELDRQAGIFLNRLEKLNIELGSSSDFALAKADLQTMALALQKPRQFRQGGQMKQFADFLENDCSPLRRRLVEELEQVIVHIERELAQASTRADEAALLSQKILVGLACAALALGSALGWSVARGIVLPLRQASRFARAVAKGDLTAPLPDPSRDEIGDLLRSLGEMRQGLARLVGGAREGARDISQASADIASGNGDLSERTESQASSLQQTAAAMALLAGAVEQGSADAQQASALASQASQAATRGFEVVERAGATMLEISQASSRVVDVIGVIDSIAFQTNILALNAAVEAARAGEQGRGFAVVANEVRSLAQRCASAAREVKTLIETSTSRVAEGSLLVRESGQAMRDLSQSVQGVGSLIERVSQASQTQAHSVNEINQAVRQIDDLTQRNAALVEEAAASAEAMSQRACELARQVEVFRLA